MIIKYTKPINSKLNLISSNEQHINKFNMFVKNSKKNIRNNFIINNIVVNDNTTHLISIPFSKYQSFSFYINNVNIIKNKFNLIESKNNINGKYFIFAHFWMNNYGHVLHDVLPVIIYLVKNFNFDKIILNYTKLLHTYIKFFSQEIFDKIYWIESNTKYKIKGTFYYFNNILIGPHTFRSPIFTESLVNEIENKHKKFNLETQNKVIYCSRGYNNWSVKHKRIMMNEDLIIETIKKYVNNQPNLKFELYTGLDKDNKLLSFEEQYNLFKSAILVIGSHGSAMSNCIYIPKNDKRAICEFSFNIFPTLYAKSYYFLYALIDFTNYSIIPFTEDSNLKKTFININDLERYLDNYFNNIK